MLNLNDVLTCKRVMDYQGYDLEYTTGLCDEVYLNPDHCLAIIQNLHSNNFGFVNYMEDLVYLLKKYDCLSKSLSRFEDVIISNHLYSSYINIDAMIKLSDKVKCDKLSKFLKHAKKIINQYGLYVPEPKMAHYDKRQNTEKNLAVTLDMQALEDGAYRLGEYTDNLYVGLADVISNIVFGTDIESLRLDYNLYYDDYLSDVISDYEYDMIAYCCKVASYILKYSNIGIYGIEIFVREALNEAMSNYEKKAIRSTRGGKNENEVIGDLFDKANYSVNNDEFDKPLKKRKYISQEELDDFKKYI